MALEIEDPELLEPKKRVALLMDDTKYNREKFVKNFGQNHRVFVTDPNHFDVSEVTEPVDTLFFDFYNQDPGGQLNIASIEILNIFRSLKNAGLLADSVEIFLVSNLNLNHDWCLSEMENSFIRTFRTEFEQFGHPFAIIKRDEIEYIFDPKKRIEREAATNKKAIEMAIAQSETDQILEISLGRFDPVIAIGSFESFALEIFSGGSETAKKAFCEKAGLFVLDFRKFVKTKCPKFFADGSAEILTAIKNISHDAVVCETQLAKIENMMNDEADFNTLKEEYYSVIRQTIAIFRSTFAAYPDLKTAFEDLIKNGGADFTSQDDLSKILAAKNPLETAEKSAGMALTVGGRELEMDGIFELLNVRLSELNAEASEKGKTVELSVDWGKCKNIGKMPAMDLIIAHLIKNSFKSIVNAPQIQAGEIQVRGERLFDAFDVLTFEDNGQIDWNAILISVHDELQKSPPDILRGFEKVVESWDPVEMRGINLGHILDATFRNKISGFARSAHRESSSGLGMGIVRNIIESKGGMIFLTLSRKFKGGMTVKMIIPDDPDDKSSKDLLDRIRVEFDRKSKMAA